MGHSHVFFTYLQPSTVGDLLFLPHSTAQEKPRTMATTFIRACSRTCHVSRTFTPASWRTTDRLTTTKSTFQTLHFSTSTNRTVLSTRSTGSVSFPSLSLTLATSNGRRVATSTLSSLGQTRFFANRRDSGYGIEPESEEEEFVDENGMTMKDRAKVEQWSQSFTKDSIPKGLLTLNFVRASGPGGQNVNKGKRSLLRWFFFMVKGCMVMEIFRCNCLLIFDVYFLEHHTSIVNTKVDMRFVVDDALWLPEYVRDRLQSQVSEGGGKHAPSCRLNAPSLTIKGPLSLCLT